MLSGIVLCGGESIRMGSDKGLLRQGNTPWSILAFKKLQELDIPVVVSIRAGQQEKYAEIFPAHLLCIDEVPGKVPCEGPLKGLISVHRRFPGNDLIALACDMTDMEITLLQQLQSCYAAHREQYDFFVFINKGKPEPLCAIYSAKGMNTIYRAAVTGRLSSYSLQAALSAGKTFATPVDGTRMRFFNNYNKKIWI